MGLIAQSRTASATTQAAPPLQAETPTPDEVILPTATLTPIGGPTATPSRTPTTTPVLAEAIGEANLRAGPGLDFDIVGTLLAGNPVPVIGRSVRYPWYLVAWADGPDGAAWVFDQLVTIIGDITTVPIVQDPAAPTIDPTQAAIQATATVLLQTPGAAETATTMALFAPTGIYTLTPGGAGGSAPGMLPTFTQPPPYIQPTMLSVTAPERGSDVLPPAVLIIALGAMGVLTMIVAVLRRV